MITLPAHIQKTRGVQHQHLFFATATSPTGEPAELNWMQLNYVMQTTGHEKVSNKLHAKLISPWTPRQGARGRKQDAFGYTAMLVFDLDKIDTLDPEVVKGWCGKYSALVHTTFSHGVDGLGCFRVYMPLDQPISASQYQAVHSGVLAKLPELAARIDPTCAEPTRCYFMPSCPPERHHLAETLGSFGGIEVDAAAMLAIPSNASAPKQAAMSPAPGSLGFVMPPPVAEGGRNTALVAALGSAYGKGFTPEAVLPLAQAWGQGCTPPMDPAEIETAVRSMWSTHTRNHPAVTATPIPRGRLLTALELAALPALEWIVKGLLPAKGLASIYGPSGSGKTFLTLDIALAIAAAIPYWFGAKVKGASVAYVALEGAAGLPQRVKACEFHNRRTAPGSVRFILGGFTLLDPQHAVQLAEDVLASLGQGAVVIVDTLNQSAPGADENSSSDMSSLIANAKTLAELVDGLVILVHHAGKDLGKGMRGHSSLHAAMDAVIEVTNGSNGRAWRVSKSKDGESGASHGFELVSYVVGQDSDGDDIRSCAVRPALISTGQRNPVRGKNQQLGLAALMPKLQASPHGVPITQAMQTVADAFDGPKGRRNSRAKEVIASLIQAGHLESDGATLVLP